MSKLGWFIRICIFLFLIYCFGVYDYFKWDELIALSNDDKIGALIGQPLLFMVIYLGLDMLLVEMPRGDGLI